MTGRCVGTLPGHINHVSSVQFSPDGSLLASGGGDNTLRIWEVASRRCLAILASLPEGWVAYTPDGRYKYGGVIQGSFWHAVNLCRFEVGELDRWLPEDRRLRLPDDAILVPTACQAHLRELEEV